MPKNRKPLSARKEWENLCNALAEDALKEKAPPENEGVEGKEGDDESWTKKAKRKRAPRKNER